MPGIAECRTIKHDQRDNQQDVKPHPVNYDPCWDAIVESRDIDEEFCADHETKSDGGIFGMDRKVGAACVSVDTCVCVHVYCEGLRICECYLRKRERERERERVTFIAYVSHNLTTNP